MLLDDILAQGEVYWTFKFLETVKEGETFVHYIEDKKSEWEDGLALTAKELCKFAETRYRHLFEAGKWKNTSTKSGTDSREIEKEDTKFIALVAAVKELAKSVCSEK
jgi:hypothetical protein